MDIKENNGGTYILWVFIIVGCLLICGGIALGIYNWVQSKNYVKVDAVIVGIDVSYDSSGDKHHYVTVEFEYDGKIYSNIPTSSYNSDMYVGQVISVLCNKDDPTKLQSKLIWIIVPCILFGMGILLVLIIYIFLHKVIIKKRGEKYARKNGEVLYCTITSVKPDTSYRVNGRFVNNIIECVPLYEKTEKYTSNPYSMKYKVMVGSIVKLYRDRNNHSNYYVDLKSIEPPTIYNDDKQNINSKNEI